MSIRTRARSGLSEVARPTPLAAYLEGAVLEHDAFDRTEWDQDGCREALDLKPPLCLVGEALPETAAAEQDKGRKEDRQHREKDRVPGCGAPPGERQRHGREGWHYLGRRAEPERRVGEEEETSSEGRTEGGQPERERDDRVVAGDGYGIQQQRGRCERYRGQYPGVRPAKPARRQCRQQERYPEQDRHLGGEERLRKPSLLALKTAGETKAGRLPGGYSIKKSL